MGDFVRAVGGWWVGAALLLVGIAGAVVFDWGGLFSGFLTAGGMLIVVVGAYRAYDHIAQGRAEPRSPPEADAGFTIEAGVPYLGIPSGVNSPIIPDVGVVNSSDTPLELKFTLLAADGSGPLERVITSARTVSAGTAILPNPMHLDPRSSRNGRLIWVHGGGDVTQYVAAGVMLRVFEAPSGVLVDIPLPTAATGYEYPTPERS